MSGKKSIEERLYWLGLVILVFGGMGVFFYLQVIIPNFAMPSCVLYRVFGIYCPGCGGTRAVVALFRGEFLKALWYHPLVVYTAVVFGGFMLTQTMERLLAGRVKGWRFHEWHMYGALVVLVLNFVVKNILLLCFRVTL